MANLLDQSSSLRSANMVRRVTGVFGADVIAEVFEVQGRFGLVDEVGDLSPDLSSANGFVRDGHRFLGERWMHG